MNEEKLHQSEKRTEEVQHIIDRMPSRFGFWITAIVLFLFVLFFVFGWIVRYPDIVSGQIIINANAAPVKLVANTYGKLKLGNVKSMGNVKEGEILAYIENATSPDNVAEIELLIKKYNPNSDMIIELLKRLPRNASLGELNVKYYAFLNALQEFVNHQKDRIYDQQDRSLKLILNEQTKAVASAEDRLEMAMNTLSYLRKFYIRDSTLFKSKVISESELDKAQMNLISSKDASQNALNNLVNARQQVQQTESKLQELGITEPEKEKELRIALISTYNDLADNIKNWEQKYVFRSPYDGKVQFLKFYTENQFVQSGEQVFTVIPKQEFPLGQVTLPTKGSGKIKSGQEVIVKLDGYPYIEYGYISGRVNTISLTSNVTKIEDADIETYMVLIDFPKELKTNYDMKLDLKAEAKGSAEIITNDRRLIQRLFDNLKYIVNK